MKSPISIAILGASGYTGEELVRICVRHPGMKVTAVTSRQWKGKTLEETLGIRGPAGEMKFQDLTAAEVAKKAEVIFLALPHGVSAEIGEELRALGKQVFDLSADFRLKDAALYEKTYGVKHPAPKRLSEAVYGLPELYREKIQKADLVACPGCYPTTAILGLAPALKKGLGGWKRNRHLIDEWSIGRGKKGGGGISFCGVQRELTSVRHSAPSASAGDRAGAFPSCGR